MTSRSFEKSRLDAAVAVLVHVEIAAQLDLDGVDAVGGAAVVGGDEAALVGIVRGARCRPARLEVLG